MLISKLEVLDKSFTYNKNMRGTRIDPWGTPQVTGKESELLLLTFSNYCSLWDK